MVKRLRAVRQGVVSGSPLDLPPLESGCGSVDKGRQVYHDGRGSQQAPCPAVPDTPEAPPYFTKPVPSRDVDIGLLLTAMPLVVLTIN
jgi:hypothetical protein